MSAPKSASSPAAQPRLEQYEILVCVTGGIAAFKSADLVSRLVQAGAGVSVAMTRNAKRFVGPTTFRALTGRPVLASMWRRENSSAVAHLSAAEAADLIVVAPATANIIGKLAGGIGDDLVSTLLLAADSPVMIAPAMNTRMWQHPAVQRNITWLRDNGFGIVGPAEGRLACGTTGPGRMVEVDELLSATIAQLNTIQPKRAAHKPS